MPILKRSPKKMKLNALLLGLLYCLLGGVLSAHQDTPLKLENGKITGLPEKYQPASFDRKKKVLTIAGKSLMFPEVLGQLFTDPYIDEGPFGDEQIPIEGHPYMLKFTASWYHEDWAPGLPPYMLIRIEPEGCDYAFELLIDIDRLKFLSADTQISKIGTIPIDLDGIVDAFDNKKGEQDAAMKNQRKNE